MENLIKMQKMSIVEVELKVLKYWIRIVVLHGKMVNTSV